MEYLTIFNTIVLAIMLIAGGWVTISEWFKTKAAAKAEAAAKAAQEKEDAIEALVQARLKALTTPADDKPVVTE